MFTGVSDHPSLKNQAPGTSQPHASNRGPTGEQYLPFTMSQFQFIKTGEAHQFQRPSLGGKDHCARANFKSTARDLCPGAYGCQDITKLASEVFSFKSGFR